jgi:hypothetical protein
MASPLVTEAASRALINAFPRTDLGTLRTEPRLDLTGKATGVTIPV